MEQMAQKAHSAMLGRTERGCVVTVGYPGDPCEWTIPWVDTARSPRTSHTDTKLSLVQENPKVREMSWTEPLPVAEPQRQTTSFVCH